MKKCAFCGSTSNVVYSDPEKGPVCQDCWLKMGVDLEDIEEERKTRGLEKRKEKDSQE